MAYLTRKLDSFLHDWRNDDERLPQGHARCTAREPAPYRTSYRRTREAGVKPPGKR